MKDAKMKTMSPKKSENKYIIYARKSSEAEERQILSIDSQLRELKDVAEKLNLNVVDILFESKSAKTLGRDKFTELLRRLDAGDADSILTWHPDRLSRNSKDSAEIIDLIDRGKLLVVQTSSQRFVNNPMDKFMLGFFMMQAKFENDHKGENVKVGLKTKAEKGWLPSGAKAGYMNDKYAEKGDKKLFPDRERFPLIRKAWEMMLTGIYGPMQVLEALNDDWGYKTPLHKRIGGKPMTRSQIYKTLTDPFYYGEFEYPVGSGNWYVGKHEPMITRDEFERVQLFLGNRGRPRPRTHEFTYTGLLRCGECEAMITAEEKHQVICSECKNKFASLNKTQCPRCHILITDMVNPTRLHYVYYHCTKRKKKCAQKSIRVEKFEKQFDALLKKIQISERFKTWAIKYLNELSEMETEDRNAILKSQQVAYDDCVKRIDNLLQLKISPQNSQGDLLSDEEFKGQKETLMKEKTILLEKLESTDSRIDQWVELTETTFDFACYARHWFANGDKNTKKQILLSMGSNLTLRDGIVQVELQKPLSFIEMAKTEVEEISPMFEPEKNGYKSSQMESFYSQNLSLLRDQDSNLEP